MRTPLRARELTPEEATEIQRRAKSRTEPARSVERAQIIWRSREGQLAPAIARALGISQEAVRLWVRRFNARGRDGLADAPRSGCPPTYDAAVAGEVLAAALTDPQELGLPFASWTLDRLTTYLHEQRGVPMRRTRIDELLVAEGLRWRTRETWFGERVDPCFAETTPNGYPPSSGAPPSLRPVV